MKETCVAVIPARGGSKRIPRKNIKLFGGKPIIAWSIEAARRSGCFDRIIVSTDDDEIADIARSFGAETPFPRPIELSDDNIGVARVMRHALEELATADMALQLACCIYATAPFITAEDILRGLTIIRSQGTDYAIGITNFAYPIQRALRVDEQNRVSMFEPEYFLTQSQDLEEAWHDAAQFCWGTAKAWTEERLLPLANTAAVKLPRYRVQDIDTSEDWSHAELMLKVLEKETETR